jgi:hypothetical protein
VLVGLRRRSTRNATASWKPPDGNARVIVSKPRERAKRPAADCRAAGEVDSFRLATNRESTETRFGRLGSRTKSRKSTLLHLAALRPTKPLIFSPQLYRVVAHGSERPPTTGLSGALMELFTCSCSPLLMCARPTRSTRGAVAGQ